MKVALVSPYSWSHPGGVNQHVEALGCQLRAMGHQAHVLAPFDGPLATAPAWLTPLGRSVALPFNGAMSHVAMNPSVAVRVRQELRRGGFDVIHVHEPVAAMVGRQAVAARAAPIVGTFHAYSEAIAPHLLAWACGSRPLLDRLNVRIAVSEAAAWTGRRFFGGEYRIVPNGVTIGERSVRRPGSGERLELLFVGQAVERKGLPVLLNAFDALSDVVPARLRLVGPDRATAERWLPLGKDVEVLERVDDATKQRLIRDADLLCAPSLTGESFGMVLTEAFAEGTPVVASDIPGYRDVVTDGVDGVLVPSGDPQALAQTLLELALDRPRITALGEAARSSADRFSWPAVTEAVLDAYADAIELASAPVAGRGDAAARRLGLRPANGGRHIPVQLLPSLNAPAPRTRSTILRRCGPAVALLAVAASCLVAVSHLGLARVGHSALSSSPAWVLAATGLMTAAMWLRAVAWKAILQAALPAAPVRFAEVMRGTSIGVLMSATVPGRVGEILRAFIVARRIGPIARTLPPVAGTIVSQTLLNLVALVVLGVTLFESVGLFSGRQTALLWYALAPVVIVTLVVGLPFVLRRRAPRRIREALSSGRQGLRVFTRPREGLVALGAQLAAWALQWLACVALLRSLHLAPTDFSAAGAGVLFAVNVSAVVPVTPSNIGVFQAACVTVLTSFHVPAADALAYGVVLQAVELATAIVLGAPALLAEGFSWRQARSRAMHLTPVSLAQPPGLET